MNTPTDSLAFDVRAASYADTQRILKFDRRAATDREHLNYINKVVANRTCFVAGSLEQVYGYAVLEYSFFGQGIVTAFLVDPDFDGQGVGAALLRHAEEACTTPRLFVTTPESDTRLKDLLERLEFQPAGRIEHVDADGALLVYTTLSHEGRWGRRR